ncbi:MAG: hypothetical protein BGO10_00255 [Chlamydia sp. 32-24]|nr:MAG: hypothetical protein BGO10_00255 [Chlamydia sp. 32-24]
MEVVPMIKRNIDEVKDILVKAYFNDPVIEWVYPDVEVRKRALDAYMSCYAEYAQKFTQTFVTAPTVDGIIMNLKPEESFKALDLLLLKSMKKAPSIGFSAIGKFLKLMSYLGKRKDELMPPLHWHLGMVAVDPKAQGKGIGKKLIEHSLHFADAANIPFYLETGTPSNVGLYEHFGFKILAEETNLPGGCPKMWLMGRMPPNSSK